MKAQIRPRLYTSGYGIYNFDVPPFLPYVIHYTAPIWRLHGIYKATESTRQLNRIHLAGKKPVTSITSTHPPLLYASIPPAIFWYCRQRGYLAIGTWYTPITSTTLG